MKTKIRVSMENKFKYELKVSSGTYYANSLIGLVSEVFTHRFNHWRKGEGWND
jgi:hypothetical protein